MFNCPESTMLKNTIIIPGSARATIPERTGAEFKQRHQCVDNEDICAASIKRLGFSPDYITPVKSGKGAALFSIGTEHGKPFILKIGIFQDHHDPVYELFFNTIVNSYNRMIPVPEIYVLDLSGEIIPWQYSIMERLPGISMKDLVTTDRIAGDDTIFEQLGHTIHQIHDIPVDKKGFGYITHSCVHEFVIRQKVPHPLQCIHGTFDERYIIPLNEALAYLVQSSIITGRDRNHIKKLLSDTSPDKAETGFLHGDMSLGNFLAEKNRVTGILDGSAVIGF